MVIAAPSRAGGKWQWVRKLRRLRAALIAARRAEPLEFEQLVVRYVIGVFTTSCAIISFHFGMLAPWQIDALRVFIPIAWVIAAGFMLHFALCPKRPVERRIATITFDAVTLSLFIYFGGEAASIFFPVYLWVILGNGFRFGIPYMYAAMLANGVCFMLVAASTPNWRADWAFATGVILSLLLIPLYVSRLIRALRNAMAQAEAANRAKSDFLANMSHELRTPLNAIIGLAQVLDRTAHSPQDRMSAVSINSAAARLLEMVDSILQFQKIESQAVSVNSAPMDPAQLLHDVESLLRPLAHRKGLSVHIHFATPLPRRILSDRDHLKTVLINLGGNAIKYTDRGHIRIAVSHGDDSVQKLLRVEVRDTGRGIPEGERDRLFDRFTQVAESVRSAEGGVGLGLSLCRSLVELMGGEIGFSSTPGRGSTFWFEVPADAAEEPTSDIAGAPAAASEIALLVRQQDRQRLMPGLRASDLQTGKTIANPRDFVKARAASGDLWRYVLVVDELELDHRALSQIRHALATAPIPPAVVVTEESVELATWANARLSKDRSADAAIIATVAAWHGLKPCAPATAVSGAMPVAPLSVLVADDNPFNREVAKKLLSLEGHRVLLANSGEEALDALLRGGVDLALLDINMPGGDGVSVCKDYQLTVGPEAHIPVVAMTADTSRPTCERCLSAGMAAVLHKPVQMNELRETIRAHMQSAPAKTDAGQAQPEGAANEADTPTIDAGQLDEMLSLFGPAAFRDNMAALFEADFERHLAALRTGVDAGHATAARDALHALKSCANTIGAARLAALCDDKRRNSDGLNIQVIDRIDEEYAIFKQALYARITAVGTNQGGAADTGPNTALQQSR